jgi:hypothetical protein
MYKHGTDSNRRDATDSKQRTHTVEFRFPRDKKAHAALYEDVLQSPEGRQKRAALADSRAPIFGSAWKSHVAIHLRSAH